jgi:hypothetical protein
MRGVHGKKDGGFELANEEAMWILCNQLTRCHSCCFVMIGIVPSIEQPGNPATQPNNDSIPNTNMEYAATRVQLNCATVAVGCACQTSAEASTEGSQSQCQEHSGGLSSST